MVTHPGTNLYLSKREVPGIWTLLILKFPIAVLVQARSGSSGIVDYTEETSKKDQAEAAFMV